jgi:hypothetical protein
MNALPRYVEYGARVNAPPPFLAREGTFRVLLLEGNDNLLAEMCKRILTEPAQGTVEYRSIGSHVMLMMGAAKFSSLAPGFTQRGYVRETQLSLWMPVTAGHMAGPIFVPDRLCMAVPYIFVDNPMSYVGGREDYGFPKSMGIFEPHDAGGDHVTVQAFGGDFAPQNEAHWTPVIDIARAGAPGQAGDATQGAEVSWRTQEELMDAALPCGIGFIADLVNSVLSGQARQVFLKQFRDCADPTAACYQAIVEAQMQVEEVSWAVSPDPWTVTVYPLESHPITADLGLGNQTAQLAIDLKMNMTQQPGVVVAP